ncbi:MAG TPA: DDE-type integrase/transposase/recombinase [Accumulibacter sp.]|uniref:DDE-type integrase/transposase/recombinase n=1 Tax=Accumulibacter sp. TaxID=2053492 RepID=UPI0025FA12DF|nr:DDE-type integrase/transposase/recombinase [Accumulibacter sp.]MCM8597085.1 DDE-type integrase/transposase/recombinase [Accumulibacter sp.]MCM8664435.1 DDE-type integrase/transposase/recombinase [Accumulibacter sp.]HNC53412.1 DDE-type integrase/transposase/recombinase [Accumulibacter sp.]
MTRLPQELTLAALRVALGWRDPAPGRVHHSDRGSQYAADGYRKVLQARGIAVSMSRKGDCWENQRSGVSRAFRRGGEARRNAPMESANGTV